MLSGRRRIIIIIISVIVGSIFAAMLLLSRKGTLSASDWSTMGINFLFALAIVFAIGILLRKMSR
jgi:hypothetical protein